MSAARRPRAARSRPSAARRRDGRSSARSRRAPTEIYFLTALVSVAIVVALYVFVGNSGVLSFGQISFVAVGAFAAGVMTVPLESKPGVAARRSSAPARPHDRQRRRRCCSPPLVGGLFALVVGMPLMRLSGLAAGIATFAVLEITHNILREWTKIGPGATTLVARPRDDRPAPGGDRRGRRDRRSPSPTSAAASGASCVRRARTPPRRRRSGSTSTGSGSGRSRSPARSPGSPAGSTSTCSARSRPTRSTSSSRS